MSFGVPKRKLPPTWTPLLLPAKRLAAGDAPELAWLRGVRGPRGAVGITVGINRAKTAAKRAQRSRRFGETAGKVAGSGAWIRTRDNGSKVRCDTTSPLRIEGAPRGPRAADTVAGHAAACRDRAG